MTIRSGGHPGGDRVVDPPAQLVADLGDHVVVVGQVGHPAGVPAPVHQDPRAAGVGDDLGHVRVGEAAGDVVDHDGAGLQRGRGDAGPGGVDAHRHAVPRRARG